MKILCKIMSALFEIFKLIFFCLVVPILLLAYLVFYALLSLAVMAIIISVITGKVDLAIFKNFGVYIMWFLILYPFLGLGAIKIMDFIQDEMYE